MHLYEGLTLVRGKAQLWKQELPYSKNDSPEFSVFVKSLLGPE